MRMNRACVLLALCGVAALLAATPVSATGGGKKSPVRIETHGALTSPTTAAGVFVISGAVSDSGTYTDSFRLVGDTIHVTKTLSGTRGSITLSAKGIVQPTSPTTATFVGGRWRITSGTGEYAKLSGGGRPGAIGSVNFATGSVDVVHEGKARR
jgi:hypothetical protein